jgi:tetratricopeptide (TPR) repeat protein
MSPLLLALGLLALSHYQLQQVWQGEVAFSAALKQINNQQFQPAAADLVVALNASPRNAHYYAHEGLLRERIQSRRIESLLAVQPVLTGSEEQQLRQAVRSYEQVLQLNPDDDLAYHNLGWLHFLLHEDREATACLRKAISLDAAIPLYHVSLGLQRERRGDREAAGAEFKTALRLSPGLLDSRFFRDFKLRSAETAERIVSELTREFAQQLDRGFDPVVAGKLAKLYLDRRADLALPLLRRATETFPSLARPWANLALYFDRNGDEESAKSCYERALFIDGSDVLSWYRLGRYFDRHNKTADAANCYAKAVNLFLRSESEHAGRVRRIYLSYYTLFDDVVPNGLSAYLMAGFNLPQACRRLSQIHAAAGETSEAARFDQLEKDYASKIDFSELP